MTRYSVLRLSVVVAAILTGCSGGESATTPDSDDEFTVSSTAAQLHENDEPTDSDGTTPLATTPVAGPDVIYDGSAGAEEAGDAVRGLLASINSGDVLGALALIDPAERDLIADLYLTTIEASAAEWPNFGGHDAITDLRVEVLPLSPLRTTLYNDHLAWVETDEVEFYMAAPTEVAASFFDDHEPWGPGSGYERSSFTHDEDSWSALTYLFGTSSDVLPGLMVTQLEGRWYVSFGRTMLELLRVDAKYETQFPAERQIVKTTPSATPQEAVIDFMTALADDRMAEAADHLVPLEGQSFGDYPAMLEKWFPGVLEFDVSLLDSALAVVQQDEGRAVVEVTELDLRIVGLDHDEGVFDDDDVEFDHELRLANRCLTAGDEQIWCDPMDIYVSAFTSLYSDLGWEGLRLVTVQGDDGWSVSLYESIAHYGLPILSDPLYGLAYSQLTFSTFGGPISYMLINETAKTLPLQTTDTITLEPRARNRILVARIKASDEGRVLHIDPTILDRDCYITIWNTDMVTDDWGEQPDYYGDEYCEDHLGRPLDIPAGVELALTLWSYGENLEPVVVELR